MKEVLDIIEAYETAQREGKQTALATVVHVEGSSYRQPGARMLVTEDGKLTGAISGGCLEGDALRKAQLVMFEKKARLVTYDTTDEDETSIGVGLGCNGIIRIFIEPVDPAKSDNPVNILKTIVAARKKNIVITLFSMQDSRAASPGTCCWLQQDGTLNGAMPDNHFKKAILTDAAAVGSNRQSIIKTYTSGTQQWTAFIEYLPPVTSLVVIGAGNDAGPLVQMAHLLGWDITVIDGRSHYATRERFPKAKKVLIARPESALQQLQIDEQTIFVLMTHNYHYELTVLQQLLAQPVPYIGILGPKKKFQRMLKAMEDNHTPVDKNQLSKIYSPVGLDIGAETAEEIAVAIITEIRSVLSQKKGMSLRDSPQAIHTRLNQQILQEQVK